MLRRFLDRVKKGIRGFVENTKGAVNVAISVIVLLVTLGIGVIVFSQVMNQASTIASNLNDTQATTFISNALNIGYNSLQLLTIGAIVLAAAAVIGFIYYFRGTAGGGV